MADDPDSRSAQRIRQTRDRLPQLRRLADNDDVYDGVELFAALCDYLDQLSGPPGLDRLLGADERARMSTLISRIRSDPGGAEPGIRRRLSQPVNAAVSLTTGRQLADRLARAGGWRAGLGEALIDLYDHLDQLHGGVFSELLNSAERRRVAAALAEPDTATLPG